MDKSNNFYKVALIIALIALFILVSVGKFVVTHYIEIDAKEKYTLFIDIIFVLLGFVALIWYTVYTTVSKEIGDRVEQVLEDSRHFTEAHSLKSIGILSFFNYQIFSSYSLFASQLIQNEEETQILRDIEERRGYYLERAIIDTRKAIQLVMRIKDKDRNELLLTLCENNLALFLRAKGDRFYQEEAQTIINNVIKKVEKYPEFSFAFNVTYNLVYDDWNIPFERVSRELQIVEFLFQHS